MPPTIALVHGAFAEPASWDRVIHSLCSAGHDAIAAANPLRSIAGDDESVSDLVGSIDGPVVLVAHSYGGVISNVAADAATSPGSMCTTQRPATQEALVEPSGEHPLWKHVPSWFLIGEEDRIVPPDLQRFMARRARAHRVLEVPGASHAAPVSHAEAAAHLIIEATAVHAAA